MSDVVAPTIWIGLIVCSAIPVVVAWAGFARSPRARGTREFFALALGSLSACFLMGGLVSSGIIGEDHSGRRYVAICANLAVVAAIAVVASKVRSEMSLPLALVAVGLGIDWFYVLFISSLYVL